MALKIELGTTVIPVEVNGLKFEVDTSDKSMREFNTKYKTFIEEMVKLDLDNLENEEVISEMLSDLMDELLGEGAFEKLYKLIPSLAKLIYGLNQIMHSISVEMFKSIVAEPVEAEEVYNKSKLKLFRGKV